MSDHVHRWRLEDQVVAARGHCACGAERFFKGDVDAKGDPVHISISIARNEPGAEGSARDEYLKRWRAGGYSIVSY